MESLTMLTEQFQRLFPTTEPLQYFFAPGRINLIGEHTDYNGGHVFPASISFGTYAVTRKRQDQKLRLYSMNFKNKGIIECDISDMQYLEGHDWANYPKGMLKIMQDKGYNINDGMDILYYGNIPNGAGLSSSASIELVTGVLLESLFNLTIDRIKLVQFGQEVENNYIGVNSGIMDQFAIGMGKEHHAILLNCQTLDYHYAPLHLQDNDIVIINTNKRRTLAGSKYNERRRQCEQALADLQVGLSIDSLGELTIETFEQHKHLIHDQVNAKRAKHAVYENRRTLEALDRLENNDLTAFGKLMNDSHTSLRDDYEVTGSELDTIVQTAWEQDGVLGARMTGAGFGGCAIAIVQHDKVTAFKRAIQTTYMEQIGYEPTFYIAQIGKGATELRKGVLK